MKSKCCGAEVRVMHEKLGSFERFINYCKQCNEACETEYSEEVPTKTDWREEFVNRFKSVYVKRDLTNLKDKVFVNETPEAIDFISQVEKEAKLEVLKKLKNYVVDNRTCDIKNVAEATNEDWSITTADLLDLISELEKDEK